MKISVRKIAKRNNFAGQENPASCKSRNHLSHCLIVFYFCNNKNIFQFQPNPTTLQPMCPSSLWMARLLSPMNHIRYFLVEEIMDQYFQSPIYFSLHWISFSICHHQFSITVLYFFSLIQIHYATQCATPYFES